MIVTLNEVEQWCLRVLAGCGTPAGVDEDAAAATAWLVARSLPVLENLIAAVERCDDAAAAAQLTNGSNQDFDAGGRSAVFLAGALIDSVVASAASGKAPAKVTVAALADPLFLLPLAERYRRRGWCFELRWGTAGARLDDHGINLLGNVSALLSADAVETSITCGAQQPSASVLPVTLSPNDLQARYLDTLERGVTVSDRTWSRLKALGMRALVPASDESRSRGAGSAASDNE